MGLLDLIRKKSKPGSRAFREEMARRLDGRHIRYVTERDETGTEIVLGKNGSLAVKGDEFLVAVPEKTLMRAKVADLDAWELMSKDGVVITAPDLERDGAVHTLTAFYVYYR
jgi:hypothetical protein